MAGQQDALRLVDSTLEQLEGCFDAARDSSAVLSSCKACRTAKVRCTGLGESCPRCLLKGVVCEYPVAKKMGRKIVNPKTLKLQQVQRNLSRLSAILRHGEGERDTSGSLAATNRMALVNEPNEEHDKIWSVLSDPLELLSLDAEEAGSSSAPRATIGLHHLDSDPTLDPINIGILSLQDWERLHAIYCENMQVFLFTLEPSLHTPSFIRNTSSFLTTAVSLAAARYCSSSAHLVPALEQHATYLTTHIYINNLRSPEIVAAFCVSSAWTDAGAPIDRSWQYMKQAVAIAAEIRLQDPYPSTILIYYQAILATSSADGSDLPEHFDDDTAPRAIERARERLQQVIFGLELTMSVQRGSIQSMLPVPGLRGSACDLLNSFDGFGEDASSADYAAYIHASNLAVNQMTAQAFTRFYTITNANQVDATSAADYNDHWRMLFSYWETRFFKIRHTPCIARLNRSILLLSFSLRLGGSLEQVLDESRTLAIQSAQFIVDMMSNDARIGFATNTVVTDIAYCCSFLIHYSRMRGLSTQEGFLPVKDLCLQVVGTLATVGAARLNGKSLASVLAQRLHSSIAVASKAGARIVQPGASCTKYANSEAESLTASTLSPRTPGLLAPAPSECLGWPLSFDPPDAAMDATWQDVADWDKIFATSASNL